MCRLVEILCFAQIILCIQKETFQVGRIRKAYDNRFFFALLQHMCLLKCIFGHGVDRGHFIHQQTPCRGQAERLFLSAKQIQTKSIFQGFDVLADC